MHSACCTAALLWLADETEAAVVQQPLQPQTDLHAAHMGSDESEAANMGQGKAGAAASPGAGGHATANGNSRESSRNAEQIHASQKTKLGRFADHPPAGVAGSLPKQRSHMDVEVEEI